MKYLFLLLLTITAPGGRAAPAYSHFVNIGVGVSAHSNLDLAKARFETFNQYAPTIVSWALASGLLGPNEGPWKKLKAQYILKRPQLLFVSGNENPAFFHLDGQVRVAKTGDSSNTPIYINTDLIAQADNAIQYDAILAILFHEYGHHLIALGVALTHDELDLLGARLRQRVVANALDLEFGNIRPLFIENLKRPLRIIHFPISYGDFSGYSDPHAFVNPTFFEDTESVKDITEAVEIWNSCYVNNSPGQTAFGRIDSFVPLSVKSQSRPNEAIFEANVSTSFWCHHQEGPHLMGTTASTVGKRRMLFDVQKDEGLFSLKQIWAR